MSNMSCDTALSDRVTIREATAADAINLAALAIQVWLDTYATAGIRTGLSEYVFTELSPGRFADTVTSGDNEVFLAQREGHVIGFGILKTRSECPASHLYRAELDMLYVQERFCGQRVGSRLLEEVETRCRATERGLWLSVWQHNQRAISFYEAHHFDIIGEIDIELDTEKHRNIVFGKTMGGK